MTIEASQYINELNSSFPRSTDLLKEGDDHIRMIKANLKNTFPYFTGSTTISSDKLNNLNNNINFTTSGTSFNSDIWMSNHKIKGSWHPGDSASSNSITNDEVLSFGHLKILFRMMYPKGSLFITNGINPADLPMFAGTGWERFYPGRYLISSVNTSKGEASDTGWDVVENTPGGFNGFTLTQYNLPNHYHHIASSRVNGSIWTTSGGEHTHDYNWFGPGPAQYYISMDDVAFGSETRTTGAGGSGHGHSIGFDLTTSENTAGDINSVDKNQLNQKVNYTPSAAGVCIWRRNDNNQPWEL